MLTKEKIIDSKSTWNKKIKRSNYYWLSKIKYQIILRKISKEALWKYKIKLCVWSDSFTITRFLIIITKNISVKGIEKKKAFGINKQKIQLSLLEKYQRNIIVW